MAVALIDKNYNTNHCVFSYDDWSVDGDSLPKLNQPGKGILATVLSCSMGSVAIGTDSTRKILTGKNEWSVYTGSGGSGSGNGGSSDDDIEPITNDQIASLFG